MFPFKMVFHLKPYPLIPLPLETNPKNHTSTVSKGDISTKSGATSGAESVDDMDTFEDEVADAMATMELEQQQGPPPAEPPVKHPPTGPTPPDGTPMVTGSMVAGLDDGLLPGDLYDERVEKMFTQRFEKLDDAEFQKLVVNAPNHPDYDSFCKGIKVELGLDDSDWAFGQDEPFYDLVSFYAWSFSRQNLRDRLALGMEVPTKLQRTTPNETSPKGLAPETTRATSPPKVEPAKEPAKVETPAPPKVEPAKVETPAPPKMEPAKVETPAPPKMEPAKVETPAPPKMEPAKVETPAPPKMEPAKVEPPAPSKVEPAKVETPAPPQMEPPAPSKVEPAKVETPPPPGMEPPKVVPTMKAHVFGPAKVETPSPPTKVATAAPPAAPLPSQLSQKVTDIATQVKVDNAPTSATHRSEYMAFLRAGRNPSKITKTLLPLFQGERLDLFRLWLEKGKDFAQVEVEVTRRNIQSQSAKAKDVCMSKSQLEADPRYSKDDVADLIKRKTQQGQYIDDPNFPGREDLRQYIINAETSAETARVREDVQQVGSKMAVSATEALSLTEPGCDFALDSHPSIKAIGNDLGSVVTPTGDAVVPGEGGKRPKQRAKAKAKAKAAAAAEGDPPKPEEPDKPPTPLAKAMALKTKV